MIPRRQRVLRSVLWNFLGTYLSRYSEYDGYWLFGFLVTNLDSREIDLLTSVANKSTPWEVAETVAVEKFADQLAKAGFATVELKAATLRIARDPELVHHCLYVVGAEAPYDVHRDGFKMTFHVEVVLGNGKRLWNERATFVAAHDPTIERRYVSE